MKPTDSMQLASHRPERSQQTRPVGVVLRGVAFSVRAGKFMFFALCWSPSAQAPHRKAFGSLKICDSCNAGNSNGSDVKLRSDTAASVCHSRPGSTPAPSPAEHAAGLGPGPASPSSLPPGPSHPEDSEVARTGAPWDEECIHVVKRVLSSSEC